MFPPRAGAPTLSETRFKDASQAFEELRELSDAGPMTAFLEAKLLFGSGNVGAAKATLEKAMDTYRAVADASTLDILHGLVLGPLGTSLLGCFALSSHLTLAPGWKPLVALIGVLQVYEFLLLGLARYLNRRDQAGATVAHSRRDERTTAAASDRSLRRALDAHPRRPG